MSETAFSILPAWDEDLGLILTAAVAAGDTALGYFRKTLDVRWKNEGRSPVSEADLAANDILKGRLLAARPDYGWLSEETDDDESRLVRETVFVVDPIDGTRAFIAGKDLWCVSVAIVHRGQPVAGVLYAPSLNEIFQATRDGEARKNGKAIAVREAESGAVLKVAAAEDVMGRLALPYRNTMMRVSHVPSLAYRLAMIADGRIDGTIVKRNSHDWDLAAADLILSRAGGALCGLDGEPLSYNRPTVTHGVLGAASGTALPALLAASRPLEPH
jgi:myo-inositol-1(or 4)-monophosphatase